MSTPRGSDDIWAGSVWTGSVWDDYSSGISTNGHSTGYTFTYEDAEEHERERKKKELIDTLDNDPELLNEILQEVRKRKINKIQNVRRKR